MLWTAPARERHESPCCCRSIKFWCGACGAIGTPCRTRCAISAFGGEADIRRITVRCPPPSAWAICERVAEAQALLHDHTEGGRFTADELVRKLAALMAEEGLLRAMWEVGYLPPDTPPPITIAGN